MMGFANLLFCLDECVPEAKLYGSAPLPKIRGSPEQPLARLHSQPLGESVRGPVVCV